MMQARRLRALALVMCFVWGSVYAHADVWVEFDCIGEGDHDWFENGQLTDDAKKGKAPTKCTVSGPSSASALQTITLTAGGGADCDNMINRPINFPVPVGCTTALGTGSTNSQNCTGTDIGITEYTNADVPYKWGTNNTDFHFVEWPLDAYTGWKNARKTWAMYLGSVSASVEVYTKRVECTIDQADPAEGDCPQSNVLTISCTASGATVDAKKAGKTPGCGADVASVFNRASLAIQIDEDGPHHQYDDDCDDVIDSQSPWRGDDDIQQPNKYVVDGSVELYTGSEKDTTYVPPRNEAEQWYESVSEDVAFCKTIWADRGDDVYILVNGVVAGQPGNADFFLLNEWVGGHTLVHEVGHTNDLHHIDYNETDPGLQNNVMWRSSSPGRDDAWVSWWHVPYEHGYPPEHHEIPPDNHDDSEWQLLQFGWP